MSQASGACCGQVSLGARKELGISSWVGNGVRFQKVLAEGQSERDRRSRGRVLLWLGRWEETSQGKTQAKCSDTSQFPAEGLKWVSATYDPWEETHPMWCPSYVHMCTHRHAHQNFMCTWLMLHWMSFDILWGILIHFWNVWYWPSKLTLWVYQLQNEVLEILKKIFRQDAACYTSRWSMAVVMPNILGKADLY